jgi:hypothetical protein
VDLGQAHGGHDEQVIQVEVLRLREAAEHGGQGSHRVSGLLVDLCQRQQVGNALHLHVLLLALADELVHNTKRLYRRGKGYELGLIVIVE